MNSREKFSKYMLIQKRRIEIEKWCKGCEIRRDPGPEFIIEWIQSNGDTFRRKWEASLCKTCSSITDCGHQLRNECSQFKKRED